MRVKAIDRGFYGGLREVDDEFDINSDKELGSWMEPLDKDVAQPTPPNPATKGFVAKHAGGGHYRIEDAQGERVGDFSGTKEEAEAEAARMNAGDPDLDDQDNGLPDA
tara:strand:- start:262 stop:585 length:324 start_codon:yes stop_codon:yes gene_type:complete